MDEKCLNCGEKIETNEIGKLNGTCRKKLVDKKNELIYFCNKCQREGKDNE